MHHYLILCFDVVFPEQSLCKNFKFDNFGRNYYALRFKKKIQILKIFSIFQLKIRVFDEVYAYLVLHFDVVFPAQTKKMFKKFILIAFVYQQLLHCEISKKCSKIKEFSFFPSFVVKHEAFELTHDCLILYFPVVLPVQNIQQKNSICYHECIKNYCLKKIEKNSVKLQNFKIFEIFDLIF